MAWPVYNMQGKYSPIDSLLALYIATIRKASLSKRKEGDEGYCSQSCSEIDLMAMIWLVRAGGMGIGMTVGRTLKHFKFLEDPVGAAQQIWEDSG